ncbi:MAG: phosphotransferase [Chloroflexi bacterium]|nr:phosphotransferase [Chloroflexota bacterium]MDA1240719.1 phosphotransferase [Chloroflexota bacterium]MQC25594.1 phosphotransferase [Chloroflexota bacterium]MQC47855.1 phosphotransferase [Chloroflexota bacterium]
MTDSHPRPPRFARADLQVHTSYGDGMDSARAIFDRVEARAELSVVGITDHDDVRGALEAREVHARGGYHFDLVTGIEVTTLHGHLLALWVDQPIPSFRRLEETVALIHEAGGLAVLPHPFSLLTRSVGRRTLDRVMRIEDAATHPDGIELANPMMRGWDVGERAARANRERWHLAETGGSDAHFLETVGTAYTMFRGDTEGELRRAIIERRTDGVLVRTTPYREIGPRRLALQQVRGLSVTPRKVIGGRIERWRAAKAAG